MAEQNGRRLDDREAVVTAQLHRSLARTQERLYADLDAVTDRILEARSLGTTTSPAWLYQQARYRELLAQVDTQMATFGGEATRSISETQRWAALAGTTDAAGMAAQAAGVRAEFLGTNPANALAAVGFAADHTPLADLFAGIAAEAVEGARDVLVQSAVLGWGAAKTARAFQQATTGLARHRADTIARTEMHRVYRSASRDTYYANRDVVMGWAWRAAIDKRTCPCCLAMDGTTHLVTDVLDGHPRCRCAMIPLTDMNAAPGMEGTGALVPRRGPGFLEGADVATQNRMLGPTKAALYRDGQISLDDLVKRTEDPKWGTMRREATIAEARAAAAARGVTQKVTPRAATATGTRRKTRAEVADETGAIRRNLPAAKAAKAVSDDPYPWHREPWAKMDPTRRQAIYPDARDVWTRGPHTVIADEYLGTTADGFLADLTRALDASEPDLGFPAITVRVPKAGTDPLFKDDGGWTGGYTMKGRPDLWVNPQTARGRIPDYVAKAAADGADGHGHFMPGAAQVGVREWTIQHELGHLVDGGNHHVWQEVPTRPGSTVTKAENRREELTFHRQQKGGLSGYGVSLPGEGYAEAYAQWRLGDRSGETVQAYAKRYGWTE